MGCWAHARRGFDEAAKAVAKGKHSPTAEQGLAYCTKLFKLEEEFADLTSEERKERALGAVEAGPGRHVGMGKY